MDRLNPLAASDRDTPQTPTLPRGALRGVLDADAKATRPVPIVFFEPLIAALPVESSFLQRRQFRILRARSMAKVLHLARTSKPGAIVVCDDPLLAPDPNELLRSLRQAVGSDSWLILLARRPSQILARAASGTRTVVLPFSARPAEILFHLARCLRVATRRHVRRTVVAEVLHDRDQRALLGVTHDVSEGGMLLETYEPLRVGDHLQLNFTLPSNVQIYAHAEILRVETEGKGVYCAGLRFTHLDGNARRQLTSFLEEPAG